MDDNKIEYSAALKAYMCYLLLFRNVWELALLEHGFHYSQK